MIGFMQFQMAFAMTYKNKIEDIQVDFSTRTVPVGVLRHILYLALFLSYTNMARMKGAFSASVSLHT